MRVWDFAFLIGLIMGLGSGPALSAEEHFILDKSSDGSVIILDDRSVWKVQPGDDIEARFWLPGDRVIVPDSEDSLIYPDESTKVEAERVK